MTNKATNRRRFISSTGLAIGGAVTAGLALPGTASAARAEREITSLVSSYGDCTRVSRKGETVVLDVRVRSHQALAESVSRADLGPVHAAGSTLSFSRGSTDFIVRHTA